MTVLKDDCLMKVFFWFLESVLCVSYCNITKKAEAQNGSNIVIVIQWTGKKNGKMRVFFHDLKCF